MATTIVMMGQVSDVPTYEAKTHVYIDWLGSGPSVRTIFFAIGEPVADYDLEFSVDSGVTWNLIAENLGTGDTPYTWTVTEAQRNIIFDNGGVNSADLIVRVVEGVTELATDEVVISMLSVVNVTPGAGIVLYENDGFLVNWDELYSSDTELFDFEIKSTGGSTWETMFADVTKNTKSLPWNASLYITSVGYLTLGAATTFHIKITGKGEHTSNYQIFPAFSIINTTQSEDEVYGDEFYNSEAFREEGGRRKAVEKAELLDEAMPLGQLESGAGIELLMRDMEGKLLDTDSVDYTKAYQLVIRVNPDTAEIPFPGDEFITRVTFGTYASPSTGEGQADASPSPNPYWGSKLYRKTITHGLDLANKANVSVGITPITTVSPVDDSWPENSSHCWWESVDVNSIYLYCIVKDPDVFNVSGYTGFPADCYKFKVVAKELRNII